ncbi:MAG: S8 family serine peptidase, partial [Bacteroidetes bacterium]|nr:S8 family serine peptidase [Bacteroidota bacterium]
KYLNVRVGKPSVNAPCYQYLAPGSELEVDGKLYDGDVYDGVATWYKDEAGNYYWSGGVELENNPVFNLSKMNAKIDDNGLQWWHKDYGIEKIWAKWSMGHGANIVVLDSGYDRNHPLSRKDVNGWNYVDDSNDFNDFNGHGTSVISAINSNQNQLYGVAPECSVYASKIIKRDENQDALIKALDKCVGSNIDIISISYSYLETDKNLMNRFLNAIEANSDKIIICSIGNDSKRVKIENKYPAMFLSTIGVGSINKNKEIAKQSSRTTSVNLVAPGEKLNLIKVGSSGLSSFQGTSYSTPFVTGVTALMVSYAKKSKPNVPISKWNIGRILIDTTDSKPSMDSELFGKGIINPLKAFKQLEKIIKS